MCNPASFVLTKDRAFWSMKTDSHSEIIKEFSIVESIGEKRGPAATRLCIVKVEITPPDKDGMPNMIAPLDTWAYRVDEEMAGMELPKWYNAKRAEKMARAALSDWHKARVIVSDCAELKDGHFWIIDCRVERMYGSSRVERMYGSSSVGCMYGSSSVGRMYGSSRVERMDGSSSVGCMDGSSSVGCMDGSSSVGCMYGSSRVERMYGSSSVGCMYGSNSVGCMYGSSRVERMDGSSRVERMDGSSSVGCMDGYSTARIFSDNVKVITERNAVAINHTTTPPTITCGWVVKK